MIDIQGSLRSGKIRCKHRPSPTLKSETLVYALGLDKVHANISCNAFVNSLAEFIVFELLEMEKLLGTLR